MTKNVAHSVRDRLLKLSKERGEEFNFVLIRYGLERFLYRLTQSAHAPEFILKGAMMFTVWSEHPHRATKDLDLLGYGAPNLQRLADVFRGVCATEVEDDGVVFDPRTVSANRIKEDAEYEGVRITLVGKLGTAKLKLQVDVGFGDAVTPEPEMVEFPTLLPGSAPRVRAYPREAVVAEKLHAMVNLGMTNTRMKDFFDLWFLCRTFGFEGQSLRKAIRATFEGRGTQLPVEAPLALTATFASDPTKQTQWQAFLSRSRVTDNSVTLPEVVSVIGPFLLPELERAASGSTEPSRWEPGGPWSV
ncbi:MAG: nucleotidyl transferase AbiEii/AbiGii toxin family protein [Polyangiaceae bacterium]|nr:nucleotidyl transferase AbiEii/AbiGii toxin family protein [Polyangiaceae bacterium]